MSIPGALAKFKLTHYQPVRQLDCSDNGHNRQRQLPQALHQLDRQQRVAA
jgi:hypothetical protein